MSAEITITLHILHKPYKLKIKPEMEESLRRSVKNINDTIIKFKSNYSGMEDFDYLAMAMITELTEHISAGASIINDSEEIEALEKLNKILNNK